MASLSFTAFFNGEILTPAVMNAFPSAVVTAFTNIDNTNVGTLGFYASQIKPTSVAQATFGGSIAYVFPLWVAVGGPLTTATTGSFSGAVSTGALTAVGVAVGGALTTATTGVFTGAVTTTANIFTAAAAQLGSVVWVGNDNAATNGIILNVPTSSTNAFQFMVNNVAKVTLTAAGGGVFNAPVASKSGTASAYVPPVYDTAGAALATTTHCVIGTTTLSGGGVATVTLTNSAVFASASSYSVVGVSDTGIVAVQFTQSSGSSFNIAGTASNVISWIAIGA